MKESVVRLSFDIPIKEHIVLKSECAQARIAMKDFLHDLVFNTVDSFLKS
jgi:hypothetical protein